jgi:hypothetical protein
VTPAEVRFASAAADAPCCVYSGETRLHAELMIAAGAPQPLIGTDQRLVVHHLIEADDLDADNLRTVPLRRPSAVEDMNMPLRLTSRGKIG